MKTQTKKQWLSDKGTVLLEQPGDSSEFYVPVCSVNRQQLSELRNAIVDALGEPSIGEIKDHSYLLSEAAMEIENLTDSDNIVVTRLRAAIAEAAT